MKEIARYSGCFVCGDENDIGLQAKFYFDESSRKAVCDVTADERYAGYKSIFHGGIMATLLDEIMIKSLLAEGNVVVTAEMTVKFKKPVYSGDSLHFEGWMTAQKGPLFLTSGQAVNQKGETVAEASGKYLKPASALSDKLLDSISQ